MTRDRSGLDGNISSAGSSCFRGDRAEVDAAGDGAPQLAGMFAGGMPKLKSRGGVATGGTFFLGRVIACATGGLGVYFEMEMVCRG